MIHSRKSALQRFFFFIIHYCACSAFSFLMTDSYLLGTEDTTDFWKDVLPFFSAAFLWMGFVTLLFLFKIPKSALLDSASRHTCQVLFFTFFPPCLILAVLCFWIAIRLQYYSPARLLETATQFVCQYFGTSASIHAALYQFHLPSTFPSHAAPYHHTQTSVVHFKDDAFTVVVSARFMPNMFDLCESNDPLNILLPFMFFCSFVPKSKVFVVFFSWMPSIEADVLYVLHTVWVIQETPFPLITSLQPLLVSLLKLFCESSTLCWLILRGHHCDFDLLEYGSFYISQPKPVFTYF